MKRKGILSILLCLLTAFSLVACKSGDVIDDGGNNSSSSKYEYYDYSAEHTSESNFVGFYSSDAGLDDFINEYAERHMRDTDKRAGIQSVGGSTTSAWREWDSMIGGWWDASYANRTMSITYAANDSVNKWLQEAKQDNQGYIWCDSITTADSWGMGWEFPKYTTHGGKGWLFDSASDASEWTLDNASSFTAEVKQSRYNVTTNTPVSEISLTAETFNVRTRATPFIRIGFSFEGSGSYEIDDLYLYYQTNEEPTWTEDKKVAFSDFCTTGFEIGSGNVEQQNYFFPMYLQEKWGAYFSGEHATREITKLKFVLVAKEGTKFSGKLAIDFVSSQYDDRQIINPCNYIIAAKNNLEYSRDSSLLATALPKARAAMNFLLDAGKGSTGLISTEYLVGHFNEGMHATGTGIGNGYWDVDAFPTVNLYCNLSFYNALLAMDYLEQMAKELNIEEYDQSVSTVNAEMNGTVTYSTATAESLSSLAELCKSRIQKEFWNQSTGRFHVGLRDTVQTVQDHGYTLFNEQAIVSGIATEEQTASIMSWINGERIVEGDDSTGDDIYYYEIAPRFNTHDIGNDFAWVYTCSWNGNVQNGGTALHLAYYDVVAESKVSTDSAYAKLKRLQYWYEKVKAAGGEGMNFYRAYYNTTDITLQGGGTAGLVGVDYEFLEAALLFRAVPDAFFGMSTRADGTICFAPQLPTNLDWWRMENLVYDGYYYDVSIGKYFLQISNVREYQNNTGSQRAGLQVTFPIPDFNFKVYVNGTATKAYTIQDGYFIVEVPFENVKIEIKEA